MNNVVILLSLCLSSQLSASQTYLTLEKIDTQILLLLSTLWTMWKSCSTVVLWALLRLQERRRSSARAAGSQRLVRTQSWTSTVLPGSILWIHSRYYRGQERDAARWCVTRSFIQTLQRVLDETWNRSDSKISWSQVRSFLSSCLKN